MESNIGSKMYILSVRDEDGYYIPIYASDSSHKLERKWSEFQLEQVDNKHWDKQLNMITAVEVI